MGAVADVPAPPSTTAAAVICAKPLVAVVETEGATVAGVTVASAAAAGAAVAGAATVGFAASSILASGSHDRRCEQCNALLRTQADHWNVRFAATMKSIDWAAGSVVKLGVHVLPRDWNSLTVVLRVVRSHDSCAASTQRMSSRRRVDGDDDAAVRVAPRARLFLLPRLRRSYHTRVRPLAC